MGVGIGPDADDHRERTVGVFRWVLDSTISKKSAAVGTGAIALRPLVDIGANEVRTGEPNLHFSAKNLGLRIFPRWVSIVTVLRSGEYNSDSKQKPE